MFGSVCVCVFLRLEESVIFQKDSREYSNFSYVVQCSSQEECDLGLYPISGKGSTLIRLLGHSE